MRKSVTVYDFLTVRQLDQLQVIFQGDRHNFHKRCLEEVIKPNMAEINQKLGQENSPDYLAYMVEYAFIKHERLVKNTTDRKKK